MQALFEATEGRARLQKIIDAFPPESAHWSEAQNRFQFVDRLLIECLGWEHPYIEVENRDDAGGKADYILGRPPRAVLEAKKEARIFRTLPSGKPSIVRKLRPLLEACSTFEQAVHQVINYCSLRGVQTAVVCNGPQLAIFQALVVGESPLDGECYLFNGLQAYLDNFTLLWSLLSPEGLAENRAYRQLALHRNPRIPPKASSVISEPTRYRYRTEFQENLRSLASLLLEDIQDHPEVKSSFYKECYVPIEANNRHLLLSKNIIMSRYRRVSDTAISPAALDVATAITESGILSIDESVLSESLGSRPVVVLGDVGVGKTSFFENLFEQLDSNEKQNTYFIHINLGVRATLTTDIRAHILEEIPSVLKSKYNVDINSSAFVNAIYHFELQSFDNGIHGTLKTIDEQAYQRERIAFLSEKLKRRDVHLHTSLKHLARGRKKQIILVIDNADQRNFETQQQAFLIAQELAASRSLLVFVSLRPSTFYKSKLTGALSGYQNRILTIAPPPADEVLKKRITFAVRVAEGKIAPAALRGIKLNLTNIVLFLKTTLRSIRDSDQIQIFLSNITGGNTRLVIELISGFCGSPNVDSEKIVRIEQEEGNYKVPLHEFTKHALLGDYAYYNPLSSLVACNVFDVSMPDPREHFLAALIISYLTSPLGLKDNDGFVSGANIISEMVSFNFLEEQIRHALRRLAERRLIETPHAHYREIEVPETSLPEEIYFRATSIGIYHLRYWIGAFPFLDAMAIDTPIFDETMREKIFKNAGSFEIRDRLQKAIDFRRYLEEQWYHANINTNFLDFSAILEAGEESFISVQRFLETGRRRPRRKR